jgi:4-methyl-5(b-hydroxyethyl)-thiazole monophosphate biosynthesis
MPSLLSRERVLVLIARGAEEADVSTMTRTLRRSGVSVAVAGLQAGPVRGAYGLSLVPDLALSEVEREMPRAAILPGGVQATRRLNADPRVHKLLRHVVEQGGYVVAIDTAYTVLHAAGILEVPTSAPGMGVENGTYGNGAVQWGGEGLASDRVSVQGQVIFARDSGAAQEAALTLVSLLENGL